MVKNKLVTLLLSFLLGTQQVNAASLGEVSNNLMKPIGSLTEIFYTICYILGSFLIINGAIKYRKYRQNPVENPISQSLTFVLIGLFLAAIPFIGHLSISSDLISPWV